jgi:probable phosphoglycerate mutase
MRVYFARHGESEANVLRVISNRDVPHALTPKGRDQAARLADSLLDKAIVHLYASPIPRAAETAAIIAKRLEVPITIDDGLREFDCGVFEGRDDPEAWDLHLGVMRRWYEHNDLSARLEGGESFEEMEDRFRKTIANILQTHEAKNETVLCITHGALLCSMLPLVLQNVTRDQIIELGLGNAIPIETYFHQGGGLCRRWGDQEVN